MGHQVKRAARATASQAQVQTRGQREPVGRRGQDCRGPVGHYQQVRGQGCWDLWVSVRRMGTKLLGHVGHHQEDRGQGNWTCGSL